MAMKCVHILWNSLYGSAVYPYIKDKDIVYGIKWFPQSPFVSVFMYLNEDTEYTEEVAMLIEEFLKQRIQGMKNRDGHYITQAFPYEN